MLSLQIYDINQQPQQNSVAISKNCFYFYSYTTITAKIISVEFLSTVSNSANGASQLVQNSQSSLNQQPKLFSVTAQPQLIIQEGQEFSNNFGYTLYIPNDMCRVVLEISNSDSKEIFEFVTRFDNIIDFEHGNEHYNDLLINNYLPTFEELNAAIPADFNNSQLIKRLLLDFRSILRKKGTKDGIRKYFDFLGYDTLQIFDLYKNSNSSNILVPNKLTDSKTGDYSVLYDNFDEDGLDADNMPIRNFNLFDISSLEQYLIKAIQIANIYFTSPEQQIIFFGLNYSSNIKTFDSITSDMNMIFESDPLHFRRNVDIQIFSMEENVPNLLVDNKLQISNLLYKSEHKILPELPKPNNSLFYVTTEFSDIAAIEETPDLIEYFFGNVLHMNIVLENKYVEYSIEDKQTEITKILAPKAFYENSVNRIFACNENSEYIINIKIWDLHNNKEEYIYTFNSSINTARIDMEIFTSAKLLKTNNITTDVDAPTVTSAPANQNNYILPENLTPLNLSQYYLVQPQSNFKYLIDNSRFDLLPINQLWPVNKISDSLEGSIADNWLEICTMPYKPGYKIMFRISDNQVIELSDIAQYFPTLDNLFLTSLDIHLDNTTDVIQTFNVDSVTEEQALSKTFNLSENNLSSSICIVKNGRILFPTEYELNSPIGGSVTLTELEENDVIQIFWYDVVGTTPYYLLTTNEGGIEFVQSLYDLVYQNINLPNDIISIYEVENFAKNKIQINYDFPLFQIGSEVLTIDSYTSIPKESNSITIEGTIYPLVRSLYTQLINISNDVADSAELLAMGDVFVARLNQDYIIQELNVEWLVRDEFTQQLQHSTNDYMLKYRVKENTVYTIECRFTIKGIEYKIEKKGILTSYTFGKLLENI